MQHTERHYIIIFLVFEKKKRSNPTSWMNISWMFNICMNIYISGCSKHPRIHIPTVGIHTKIHIYINTKVRQTKRLKQPQNYKKPTTSPITKSDLSQRFKNKNSKMYIYIFLANQTTCPIDTHPNQRIFSAFLFDL